MAERYEDQYRDRGRRDDRGFMDRAGDEVRSWFGDDDAERRRQMDDRDRDRERFRDQQYGQSSDYRRGYGDRGYGFENRGYGDRSFEDRGYSDRGYGYGAGAGDRSWGQGNYRGQEGYRSGQGYGGDDRSGYGRSSSYGASGFRGAGEGYGMYPRSGSGYGGSGVGYGSDYDRGMGYSGRGPKGYQRSDARINEDVCDRLCDAPDIDASNIEVRVSGGEVTLTGTVNDRDAKRRAEDLAERVSGVREVCNNLRVDRSADAGHGSSGLTGTSGTTVGSGSAGGDVAHPGITGGGPSGATNISTSPGTGGAAGAPENPLGLRENTDTKTSTAGGRR